MMDLNDRWSQDTEQKFANFSLTDRSRSPDYWVSFCSSCAETERHLYCRRGRPSQQRSFPPVHFPSKINCHYPEERRIQIFPQHKEDNRPKHKHTSARHDHPRPIGNYILFSSSRRRCHHTMPPPPIAPPSQTSSPPTYHHHDRLITILFLPLLSVPDLDRLSHLDLEGFILFVGLPVRR